jgi:hypothetical protein
MWRSVNEGIPNLKFIFATASTIEMLMLLISARKAQNSCLKDLLWGKINFVVLMLTSLPKSSEEQIICGTPEKMVRRDCVCRKYYSKNKYVWIYFC